MDMTTAKLNSFDADERQSTLAELLQEQGSLLPDAGPNFNMHCHSFFSYNADGWSPSRIAWEARRSGWHAAGLCDFDVLDGVAEFLDAGLRLGLRATANLETRVFFPEYRDVDLTSPGEQGVTYIMGAGFTGVPAPGTAAAATLTEMAQGAGDRNRAVIGRINAELPQVAIDYEQDVVTTTPGGTPTERHIVSAYAAKAAAALGEPAKIAEFWSGPLAMPTADVLALMQGGAALELRLRSCLMKRGGLAYEQPSEDTFPSVDAFIEWVQSCDAIPMLTWLDGTSEGESKPGELLDCMIAKGAAAMNIVPDRNWNIEDPEVRELKRGKLAEIVREAEARELPINIGTELNKAGLPLVDDVTGEVLSDYAETFRMGANIMVGHTVLQRYASYGYTGVGAAAEFGDRLSERNGFFAAVGAMPPLSESQAAELQEMGQEKALSWFREAVSAGR
jgi:hypothetical protein